MLVQQSSSPRHLLILTLAAALCVGPLAVGLPAQVCAQGAPQKDAAQAAVMNLEGDLEPEMSRTLTAVLRNEAQQHERFQLVNAVALGLSDTMALVGCSERTSACLSQVAEQLKADVLLFGDVEKTAQGKLRFVLHFFDRSRGRVTNRLVRQFDAGDDLVVAFRRETEAFFTALGSGQKPGAPQAAAEPATLRVTSDVEGATIVVDGRPAGALPYSNAELAPGRHTVEVRLKGYETWRAVVDLEPGGETRLQAPLRPARVAGAPAAAPRPVTGGAVEVDLDDERTPADSMGAVNWPAWGLMGLGTLALAGSGFSAIQMFEVQDTLDEKYAAGTLTHGEREELIQEGRRYETAHQGLLAGGGLLVGLGALWLVFDLLSEDDEAQARGLRVGVEPPGLVVTFP